MSGPYHAGERQVQARAGVSEDARHVGRIIGRMLPPQAGAFLAAQTMAVAASLDGGGMVWASLLTGPPGFVAPVDDGLVVIEGADRFMEPLVRNLAVRPELGLVVIDLVRRRRLRLNGRALVDGTRLFLSLEQAYANCPRYIVPRQVEPVPLRPAAAATSTALDARQQEWIARADTLFLASAHPQGGADASHRGGAPGFVRVAGPNRLSFPDHAGNNMFNTLGNIVEEPRVGLLFLDFASGDVLQLTGRAEVVWGPEDTGRTVAVELDRVVETRGGGVVARSVSHQPPE